ncbi:MAG: Flp pilus assembly protein CpaB [Planctomycetota bacterium]
MKPKTIIPLIIGLGVGFFAVKMGLDMVQRAKGAQGGEVEVLISGKQIEVASKISANMLSSKKVPQALVPTDAFTTSKELVGRVTAMTVAPGVPITQSMLAPPGSEPGLRAIIPNGMRAVSVSVNEETAVAGFIMPGCHVDVSAVGRDHGPAKLILSDAEVGAVGQSLSRVGEDGKTVRMEKSVTLFLKPEEVQILHAYGGSGRIRLALRGAGRDPGEPAWMKMLKASLEKKVNETPREKPKGHDSHVVDVVRGQEYQKLVFDTNGNMRRIASEGVSAVLNEANAATTQQPPNPRTEVHE